MSLLQEHINEFFAFARERHAMYLRRANGVAAPWTEDPILSRYRFTNVFRELDKTTQWFAQNVRNPLRNSPEVLLATVLFRWFNRITTGEAIFKQMALPLGEAEPGESAWSAFLRTGDIDEIRAAVRQYCDPGPYVTGAYIIKTPDGMDKLDGVLWCVEQFAQGNWKAWAEAAIHNNDRFLKDLWNYLLPFPYMGPFMAYEVVSDIRHTALLRSAPDVDLWANPGPGCQRGLSWLRGIWPLESRNWKTGIKSEQMLEEMRSLLELSRDPKCWPQRKDGVLYGVPVWHTDGYPLPAVGKVGWPAWELHEVEMTLCEMDKYLRTKHGVGKPKQIFR